MTKDTVQVSRLQKVWGTVNTLNPIMSLIVPPAADDINDSGESVVDVKVNDSC